MKKSRREEFLEQLRTIPNVSLACEKTGLSRNTVYRWCKEDKDFKGRLDDALETGTESVSDLAESKLITHINNGSMRAIEYWLDNHKRAYARPRPKDFWDVLRGNTPVTEINILPPLPPEEARQEHLDNLQNNKDNKSNDEQA